jgi:hypothetical protein
MAIIRKEDIFNVDKSTKLLEGGFVSLKSSLSTLEAINGSKKYIKTFFKSSELVDKTECEYCGSYNYVEKERCINCGASVK